MDQNQLFLNEKNNLKFIEDYEMIDLTNKSDLSIVHVDDKLAKKVSECMMTTDDLINNNVDFGQVTVDLNDLFSRDYLNKLDQSDEEIDENLFGKIKDTQNRTEEIDYFSKHKRSDDYLDKKFDPINLFSRIDHDSFFSDDQFKHEEFFNKIDKKIENEEIVDNLNFLNQNLIENDLSLSPAPVRNDINKFIQAFNVDEVEEAKKLISQVKDLNQSYDSLNTSDSDAIALLYEQQWANLSLEESFESNKESNKESNNESNKPTLKKIEDDLYLSDDNEQTNTFKEQIVHDETSLKDVYKIEKLLAKRYKKNGRLEYLVKYENLDVDQLYWESEKTLDSKIVAEFNRKYGDKLLLKDLDKKSFTKYFDERVGETSEKKPVDLPELIELSLKNPLCNVYNNVKPERIIGVYKHDAKFYYLVKWEKLTKADLYDCEKFQEKYPDVVIQYYESKIMFNELDERRRSDAIRNDRKVSLK